MKIKNIRKLITSKTLYQAALAVDVQQVISDGFEKQGIRDELTRRRIAAVKAERKLA